MSKDTRREQLIDIINKEFVGPDPVDYEGMIQQNGEEILNVDPPRIRYSAGVLFPQGVLDVQADAVDEKDDNNVTTDDLPREETLEESEEKGSGSRELIEDAEELINLSNAFHQSAISLTAAVVKGEPIRVTVSAGMYNTITSQNPSTLKKNTKYVRSSLLWNNVDDVVVLPTRSEKIIKIYFCNKEQITNLKFIVISSYNDFENNYIIYTFTLENYKKMGYGSFITAD